MVASGVIVGPPAGAVKRTGPVCGPLLVIGGNEEAVARPRGPEVAGEDAPAGDGRLLSLRQRRGRERGVNVVAYEAVADAAVRRALELHVAVRVEHVLSRPAVVVGVGAGEGEGPGVVCGRGDVVAAG